MDVAAVWQYARQSGSGTFCSVCSGSRNGSLFSASQSPQCRRGAVSKELAESMDLYSGIWMPSRFDGRYADRVDTAQLSGGGRCAGQIPAPGHSICIYVHEER